MKHKHSNVSVSDKQTGFFSRGRVPHSHSNAHSVTSVWPYTRACIYWLLAHSFMCASLGSIGYGIWKDEKNFMIYGVVGVVLCLLLKLCLYLACKATPCPLCRANHLANSRSNKHKDAYKIFLLSYGASAVVTALFIGCVRCMHCGVSFTLKRSHK